MPSEKTKMLAGELYRAADPELAAERLRARRLADAYNASRAGEAATRARLLRELFGACGEGVEIEPRFACDYGYNIRIGHRAFVNFNCVFLDCAPIEIGDDLQMGPAVQLYAAFHPLDREARRSGLEMASPIRIGDAVWIGGAAVILPGVTIGDGCIVGAGAVVTRDLPAGSLAVGNPARVIKTVS